MLLHAEYHEGFSTNLLSWELPIPGIQSEPSAPSTPALLPRKGEGSQRAFEV